MHVIKHAQSDNVLEEQIKATYIYQFTKFTEWPNSAVANSLEINLCVLGSSPVNEALQIFDGRKTDKYSIHLIYLPNLDSTLKSCPLLFINKSEQARYLIILKSIQGLPILTVSDIDDFAEKGGGIGLISQENKVKFEVNLDAIKNAGLRLSAQLLNIANNVYGK